MRNLFKIRRIVLLVVLAIGLGGQSTQISSLILGKSNLVASTTSKSNDYNGKSVISVKKTKQANAGTVAKAKVEDAGIKFTYGENASWSSCEPVKYYLTEGTSEAQEKDVALALDKVGSLKGVKFEFYGFRSEVGKASYGETLENGSFRPVLISFVDPKDTDMLGANNAGGTVVNRSGSDQNLFVTGVVVINLKTYNNLKQGFTAGKSQGNLLMHEFGHLVGLDHVSKNSALMNPIISESTENGFSSAESDVLHNSKAVCKG